jgi:hypothetical protein
MLLAEKLQAFEAADRRMNVVAMPSQDGLQEIAVHTVVIDDEDLDHSYLSMRQMACATVEHAPSLSCGLELEKEKSYTGP